MFFLATLGHICGEGADKPVTEQDAQKCPHQSGGYFVADFFGRPAEGAHGDDDAEHGGDDAETGEGIGHGRKSGNRL